MNARASVGSAHLACIRVVVSPGTPCPVTLPFFYDLSSTIEHRYHTYAGYVQQQHSRSSLLAACQQTRRTNAAASSGISSVYPRAILKMGTVNRYSGRRATSRLSISLPLERCFGSCPTRDSFAPLASWIIFLRMVVWRSKRQACEPPASFAIVGSSGRLRHLDSFSHQLAGINPRTIDRFRTHDFQASTKVTFPSGHDSLESRDAFHPALSQAGVWWSSLLLDLRGTAQRENEGDHRNWSCLNRRGAARKVAADGLALSARRFSGVRLLPWQKRGAERRGIERRYVLALTRVP